MLPEPTMSTPSSRSPARAAPSAWVSAGPAEAGRDSCTTGRSASGSKCISGTQAPWSKGRCALARSEEHTSELQSQSNLVCRLLLEKKKKKKEEYTIE